MKIEISGSKLDSSILNNGKDITQKGEAGLHVILESLYLITISQVFVLTLKAFL